MRTLNTALPRLADGTSDTAGTGAETQRFSISIVATTEGGTRAALTAARALGKGLGPHVVLFVPHVVPHLQPLEPLSDCVASTRNRYLGLVEEVGTDALVQVCVCRPDDSSLARLVPRGDTVLVGGSRRHLWLSREERLARDLAKSGLRVLFIEEAGSR